MLVDIGLIPLTAAVFLITGLVVGNEGVRKLRMKLKRLSRMLRGNKIETENVKADCLALEIKANRLRAQIDSAIENRNKFSPAIEAMKETSKALKFKMAVDGN